MSKPYQRNLPVPFFSQRDNRYIWQRIAVAGEEKTDGTYIGGERIGSPVPMADKSCNITSLCMILHYFGITDDTPDEMMRRAFEEKNWLKEEIKLRIKTFEAAEFNPNVKIELWEREEERPEICIKEYEIVIDKDEIELDVQTAFAEEELHAYRHQQNYTVHAKLICETLNIKNTKENSLQIETEDLYD
jgi:hypothetical protein